jgi:Na+/proline symporter
MTVSNWVIVYLVVTVLVGLIASRMVRNSDDFLSASRKVPFLLSSFALFAFWFGSETVFGASSEFIQHGLLGVIEDPFGAFLCLILFALIFVRPLYRQNINTLGDLFRKTYGPRIETIASVFMQFTFLGYVAAQIIALSILFDILFGLDPVIGKVTGAAIVTLYTAAGGMWAVSITDFIQSIVIVVGLILLAIFFTGMVDGPVLTAPTEHFFDFVPTQTNEHSWMDYLSAWLTVGLGSLASQDIFQRANAAKSEKIAVRSTYVGAMLYLIMAMLPLYLGLLSLQIDPSLSEGDAQYALLGLVSGYAPIWLQVLFMGALVSAIFSTSSGAILAPSSILSENLIKPLFIPNATDKQFLLISRLSVVFIGILAAWLSLVSESIYDLVAQSSILGAVSILVPMFCALFMKPSKFGALLAMTLGMTSYFVVEFQLIAIEFPAMLIGIGCSIGGMMLGNLIPSK